MTKVTFKGSKGGGGSFKQTPDNLRSTDTFEGVLGIGIGPMKGLVNGLKSLKIDGTVLESESGELNFTDFTAIYANGDPAQHPQKVELRLGQSGAPLSIGLSLTNSNAGAPGPWVVRTLANTNASAIDLRFPVQSLYRQDKKGVFNETMSIEIQMKPSSASTWINPNVNSPPAPYSPQGQPREGFLGQIIYPKEELYDETGDYLPSSPYFVITGKTTSVTVYELRIQVPNTGAYANTPWDVRCRLIEKDSLDADPVFEKRTVSWESMSAIYDTILGEHEDWRGVSWLQIYGKASNQLSGIPEITGEYDTKIVSVPATVYNAATRSYTGGLWDGSWAKSYTNDPAWVINDAISDSLSGLSLIAEGSHLNKWDALEASKWFSQQVPDGAGGTHPRYCLNLSTAEPQKAEEFIQFLGGGVGALVWDQGDGEWRMKVDKPETAIDIFTLENIIGEFSYGHTDVDTRANDIIGQFKNADMEYRADAVRLFSNTSIAKIGRKPLTIALVGCTNRQEAARRVMLRLRAAEFETKMVNFSTNRRGRNLEALSTILVADGDLGDSEQKTTGRVISIAPDRMSITVRDRVRIEVGVSYTVKYAIPNPNYNPTPLTQPTNDDWDKPTIIQSNLVTNTTGQRGSVKTIYLTAPLPENVAPLLTVSLEATSLPTLPKMYRVTAIQPNDDGETINIAAIEVDTGKWDASDNVTVEASQFQDLRGVVPKPIVPSTGSILNVTLTPGDQLANVLLSVSWVRPPGAFINGFHVRYRLNGGEWTTLVERTQLTSAEIVNPTHGDYEFEVITLDRRGSQSLPTTGSVTIDQEVIDAALIAYADGTLIETLKPAGAGATAGATWGVNVGGRPTNLSALVGTEVVNNAAISLGNNGVLTGGSGGNITVGGIGYNGALGALDPQGGVAVTVAGLREGTINDNSSFILPGLTSAPAGWTSTGTVGRTASSFSTRGGFVMTSQSNGYMYGSSFPIRPGQKIFYKGRARVTVGEVNAAGGARVGLWLSLSEDGITWDDYSVATALADTNYTGTFFFDTNLNVPATYASGTKIPRHARWHIRHAAVGSPSPSAVEYDFIEAREVAEAATVGANWGVDLSGRPANVAGLGGSEVINNAAISLGANGVLTGGSGGSVTVAGIGYAGALAALDSTASASLAAAAASASSATTAIADLTDEGKVGPEEKYKVLIPQDARLESAYAELDALAASLGVTTERTAATTARSTWQTYRNGLSPTWNNTGFPTPVNRTTFRTNILGYGAALDVLQRAISLKSSTLSTWTGTSSRPSNLVSLSGSEVVNNAAISLGTNGVLTGGSGGNVTIGGLGYAGSLTATDGATWGTNVSSRPANLSALAGSEVVNNAAISLGTNGVLTGGSGGNVTIGGLGYVGSLSATNGATWNTNVSARPANLSALAGSEVVNNAAISLGSNGVLTGGSGGGVTVAGLGYAGALSALDTSAAAKLVMSANSFSTYQTPAALTVGYNSVTKITNSAATGDSALYTKGIMFRARFVGTSNAQSMLIAPTTAYTSYATGEYGFWFDGTQLRIVVNGTPSVLTLVRTVEELFIEYDNVSGILKLWRGPDLVYTATIATGLSFYACWRGGGTSGYSIENVLIRPFSSEHSKVATVEQSATKNVGEGSLNRNGFFDMVDPTGAVQSWSIGAGSPGITRLLFSESTKGQYVGQMLGAASFGYLYGEAFPVKPGEKLYHNTRIKAHLGDGGSGGATLQYGLWLGISADGITWNDYAETIVSETAKTAATWYTTNGSFTLAATYSGVVPRYARLHLRSRGTAGADLRIDYADIRDQEESATVGAAWTSNLSGRPANLSALAGSEVVNNAAISLGANGTLSGGGGGAVTPTGLGLETGADVTKSVGNGPTAFTVDSDYLNVPKTSNWATYVYKLITSGGTELTSGVTWHYKVVSGSVNGYNSASGYISMTGSGSGSFPFASISTDSAVIQIRAQNAGRSYYSAAITFVKNPDAPPVGGGGGGGGGASTIYGPNSVNTTVTNTTWTTLASGGTVSGTIPTGKTSASISLSCETVAEAASPPGTFNIEYKLQRDVSGVWTDVGSSFSTDPDSVVEYEGGSFYYNQTGYGAALISDTGLTAGVTYTWRVQAKLTTGTKTHSVYASVTVTS